MYYKLCTEKRTGIKYNEVTSNPEVRDQSLHRRWKSCSVDTLKTPEGEQQHTISQYKLSPALTVSLQRCKRSLFLWAATRWRGWLACKGHSIWEAYHFTWQNHSQHSESSHSEETGETTWSHRQVTPPPLMLTPWEGRWDPCGAREDGVHVGQGRGVEQAQVNIHKFENKVLWHNCT